MHDSRTVKNILIIKWGALGDMVASTPAIKSVREAFPYSKIILVTNKLMRQIIPENSIVDELYIDEKIDDRGIKGMIAVIKTAIKLRRKKIDIAVNLRWTSDRCAFLTFLCGAKTRVSSGPQGLMSLYTIKVNHPTGRYHEIFRNLDIVKALGVSVNPENHYVFILDEERNFAGTFLNTYKNSKENTIVIHPGASKANRAWNPSRFAEIASILVNKYQVNVIVTWGKNEFDIAEIVKGNNSKIILAPETKSIGQLAAIINNSSLFISNCTGPMNIAVAVKTPVIALLGSSDATDWGPYGQNHRVIKSPLVLEHYSDEDERKAFDMIEVDAVWAVVEKRMRELYPMLSLE